jgi:putative FmdB family regulatory protein
MPLYEYQCDSCGHRFEQIQKFSDPPVDKCPKCDGQVRKLVSSPAFQFKGSGWYVTDYARKADTAKADGKPAGETGKEGSSSGDSASKETAPAKDSGSTSEPPAAKAPTKPPSEK